MNLGKVLMVAFGGLKPGIMDYPVQTDLIQLIRHLIGAMQPFAEANSVTLSFTPEKETCFQNLTPGDILSDLARLLCKIIIFTPQDYSVNIKVIIHEQLTTIQLENTGADLSSISDVLQGVSTGVVVSSAAKKGTCFQIQLLREPEEQIETEKPIRVDGHTFHIPAFYKRFQKDLDTYFKNLPNLEKTAENRGSREGVFLKKVNAVILAHLDKEGFGAEPLADALALSRAQLFRKLKPLAGMPPGRYIRFVRLLKAKELLEREDVNIGEAAFQTGFINQSHFTRAFREQFGFNPSEIIKQVQ